MAAPGQRYCESVSGRAATPLIPNMYQVPASKKKKCTRHDLEYSHLLAGIKLSTNISQTFANNQ